MIVLQPYGIYAVGFKSTPGSSRGFKVAGSSVAFQGCCFEGLGLQGLGFRGVWPRLRVWPYGLDFWVAILGACRIPTYPTDPLSKLLAIPR